MKFVLNCKHTFSILHSLCNGLIGSLKVLLWCLNMLQCGPF